MVTLQGSLGVQVWFCTDLSWKAPLRISSDLNLNNVTGQISILWNVGGSGIFYELLTSDSLRSEHLLFIRWLWQEFIKCSGTAGHWLASSSGINCYQFVEMVEMQFDWSGLVHNIFHWTWQRDKDTERLHTKAYVWEPLLSFSNCVWLRSQSSVHPNFLIPGDYCHLSFIAAFHRPGGEL